jgi:hypothetical protein
MSPPGCMSWTTLRQMATTLNSRPYTAFSNARLACFLLDKLMQARHFVLAYLYCGSVR